MLFQPWRAQGLLIERWERANFPQQLIKEQKIALKKVLKVCVHEHRLKEMFRFGLQHKNMLIQYYLYCWRCFQKVFRTSTVSHTGMPTHTHRTLFSSLVWVSYHPTVWEKRGLKLGCILFARALWWFRCGLLFPIRSYNTLHALLSRSNCIARPQVHAQVRIDPLCPT